MTLTDPSGHAGGAAADAGGDLAQILAQLAFLAQIAALEIGAGIGRALRWAGWVLAAVAAVLFCLNFAPCRENASSAGGATQDAVSKAVAVAAETAQSAQSAWRTIYQRSPKPAPEPEEEPTPEPTAPPPPPPPDDDNGSCLTARENQYLMPEREVHIRQLHGPRASRRKGKGIFDATFFRDLGDHIYDTLRSARIWCVGVSV